MRRATSDKYLHEHDWRFQTTDAAQIHIMSHAFRIINFGQWELLREIWSRRAADINIIDCLVSHLDIDAVAETVAEKNRTN